MEKREKLAVKVVSLTECLMIKYNQFQLGEIDEYVFTQALVFAEERMNEIDAEMAVMELLENINMN